jgi:hypothetical protein
LPPLLEAWVLALDGEPRVLDGIDTRVPEQLCEVTAACSRKGALAGSLGIETRCRRPEQTERAPTLIEVPDTRRHDAAGLDDTTHVAKAGDRVGHEVHDKRMALPDGFHERR